MEARLARLYERLGSRYIVATMAVAWGMAVVWVTMIVAIGARLWGMSVSEFFVVLPIVELALVPTLSVITALVRRDLRALVAWIDHGGGHTPAIEAQKVALAFPGRLAKVTFVVALPVIAPIATIAITSLADRTAVADMIMIAVGVLIAVFLMAFLFFYCFAVALRPLAADISPQVELRSPPPGAGLRPKLLTGLVALILAGGIGTAVFTSEPGSGAEGLFETIWVALALSATWGVLGVFVIANMVLGPVKDLTRGTYAVRDGALDVVVPVTSADEFGDLAASFNEMVAGLRERARLAGENEKLLDEVRASRARIIAASDAERRRVERNIHDGAQQRLVAHALALTMIEDRVTDDPELQAMVHEASDELKRALAELRELARGLHPQVLSTDGLRPALEQLGTRAPVPVQVSAPAERFPEAVESTVYFVASEALANVAKYAGASTVSISIERRDGRLHIAIADDGKGGAAPEAGSGLAGLADRVAALDGRLTVDSPLGAGTRVRAELPLGEIQR